MEKYFVFKYYVEIGEIILLLVILIVCIACLAIGKILDKWDARQKKKNDKYWKDHEDG